MFIDSSISFVPISLWLRKLISIILAKHILHTSGINGLPVYYDFFLFENKQQNERKTKTNLTEKTLLFAVLSCVGYWVLLFLLVTVVCFWKQVNFSFVLIRRDYLARLFSVIQYILLLLCLDSLKIVLFFSYFQHQKKRQNFHSGKF